MRYKIKKGEKILLDFFRILSEYSISPDECVAFYGSMISKEIYKKYLNSIDGYEIKGGSIKEKDNVKRLLNGYGFAIGIGGGKILDTVKLASGELNKPFISIPSTISNDGIFSPVSVLVDNKEVKSIITNPPEILIIDFDIILKSPKELILSGIGDLVANISALKDWKLASEKRYAEFNKEAYALSYNGVMKILKTGSKPFTIKFIDELVMGLIESGLAMNITKNSRPASGAEHLISHALDKLLKKPKPHGMQCGFATIFTLNLWNEIQDIKNIMNLFKKTAFPKNFKEIGIERKLFLKAVELAPNTRPERYTILNEVSKKEIQEKIKILID